jgi:hypothetical protein
MSDRYRRPNVVSTGDIRDMTHGAATQDSDDDGTSTLDSGGGDGGDGGGDTGSN